eukprot:TRINITY_DN3690_c0_g2_i1.p1 TRINITY_DN3690_c0_g2~~TRINITY_DN3690_c0_g2_i1.p1  ORF type:complete len:520 (+),score=127.64 TRINITY_DN3690_c0_g2_i1:203-1561(+)
MASLTHRRLAEAPAAVAVVMREPIIAAQRQLRQNLRRIYAGLHQRLWKQLAMISDAHRMFWAESANDINRGRVRQLAETDEHPVKEVEEKKEKDKKKDEAELLSNIDLAKVTKTQIFALVMVVLIMFYSVPLMGHIVLINGYFDRHEDLLIKQSESHRTNHDARVKSKEAEDNAMTEALSRQVVIYEKMLKTTTESARKSRERFPLKLFGFVISGQLLATWIILAGGSMAEKVKDVTPGLVIAGCNQLAKESWVSEVGSAVTAKVSSAGIIGKKKWKEGDAAAMLSENICKPLKGWVTKQWNKAVDAAQQNFTDYVQAKVARPVASIQRKLFARARRHAANKRRLTQELYNMDIAVQTWWKAYPNHSTDVKTLMVQLALDELQEEAHQLLSVIPTAVAHAFDTKGEAGFWEALGTLKPLLGKELRREEAEEAEELQNERSEVPFADRVDEEL